MEDGKIRLNSVLVFDEGKEKDIIEAVEQLATKHKLSAFIGDLLRLALEQPESFQNTKNVANLLQKMDYYGVTPTRYKYFEKVANEIKEMKNKIDAIYEMAYKCYMLGLMGKMLGITEKAENNLRGTFILQRQLNEMSKALGVENVNSVYISDKLINTEDKANEILEYILESYDSIIEELKDSLKLNISAVGVLPEAAITGEGSQDNSNVEDEPSEKEESEDERDIPKLEGDRLALFKQMTMDL